jgi:uncharacterized glyoxalase superfamily protein PhnB
MSNNLIRKGLAFVATASLALAGVVGISSPANAAPSSVVIESSFGATSAIQTSKTQNGVLGAEFNLNLQAPGVVTGDEVLLLVETTDANIASMTVSSRYVTDLTTAVGTTAYAEASASSNHTIRTAGTNKIVIQPSYTSARLSSFFQLNLNLSATYAATKTVTITPFVDDINNDAIDSSEVKGTPIVITFHRASELAFATQLVTPTSSSQVLRADTTVDKDVNVAQWRTNSSSPVRVNFLVNGAVSSTGTNIRSEYSSTATRAIALTTDTIPNVPSGAVLSVQQSILLGAYAASGTTAGITAGDVLTIGTVDNAGGNVTSGDIRVGDGTFSVETTTTPKAGLSKKGQTVTFTIEENTANGLAAAAAVTAGGKSLTNSSATTVQSITVDVLTDADGVATLPISYTGLVATNALKITAGARSVAGGVISTPAVTKTAVASVATALVDLGKINSSGVRSVVPGGNVSIQYRLVDQFGQIPTGVYQASVTLDSVTNSGAVFSNVFPVVNGLVTVSFNDTSNVAAPVSGSYTVRTDINKQATNGSYPADGASGGLNNVDSVIQVRTAAQAAATLTLTGVTQAVTRSTVALASVDTRVARTAVTSALATGTTSDLSGTVVGSNGTLQVGVPVTLSAPGVMFVANVGANTEVRSLGSITVHTDNNGAWGSIRVNSNLVGAQLITATAGSATKTLSVTFTGTVPADADKLTVTAPKSIKNGRTLTMTAKLVDKFGNAVSGDASRVRITYSGPGFEIKDPATAEIAATTGVYTLRVVLASGDTGPAVLTAVYDVDGVATADTNFNRLTATAATWVGPVANAKAGDKAGRVIVEAYRAKGKTVSVFVGSTRVASFVSNKADFTKVVRGVKAGTRNVSVRLSGPGGDFTGAITVK